MKIAIVIPAYNEERTIRRIVEKASIHNIALGSDFDGTSVPNILKDISLYQNLLQYLEEHGYNRKEVELIASKNYLRVTKEIWK